MATAADRLGDAALEAPDGGQRAPRVLYDDRESENPREITLKPSVAYCFRRVYSWGLSGMVRAKIQVCSRTNSRFFDCAFTYGESLAAH